MGVASIEAFDDWVCVWVKKDILYIYIHKAVMIPAEAGKEPLSGKKIRINFGLECLLT